ncbi:hypothetical protein BCR39DRAFT_512722 [Naematelia encephala]|uniref:Uncharacterized protein n=1 Tax=Naematelia encephala TaxID=71784 RepID=A0A1Y2BM88_9TREE|nr:hypothetical protein BCR39DRAFT_512722 [Naematelia encephala]
MLVLVASADHQAWWILQARSPSSLSPLSIVQSAYFILVGRVHLVISSYIQSIYYSGLFKCIRQARPA